MYQNINKSHSSLDGEIGRSMVEMLGVLAIIGVLSVGGIAGYKVAMTKHKANELLNEAAKRAVVVATKIAAGQPTNINEFDNTVGDITITLNSYTAGSPTFSLSLATVDEAVCTQMKNVVSADSQNPKISEDAQCATLTYNADLGNGTSGGNTSSSLPGSECSGTTCGIGGKCVNGYCECESGVWVSNNESDPSAGSCVTPPGNGECSTNKDCNDGQETGNHYCHYNGKVHDSYGPTGKGVCIATSADYNNTITIDGHDYVASYYMRSKFDWWSAKNFCAAYGKHMMSLSDLGCVSNVNCMGGNTLFQRLNESEAIKTSGGGKGAIGSWTTTLRNSSNAFVVKYDGNDITYPRNYWGSDVFCR